MNNPACPKFPECLDSLAKIAAAALIFLFLASSAFATIPASPPDPLAPDAYQLWLDGGPRGPRVLPDYLGPFNYLREFVQMTDFLAEWQVLDPTDDDFGGMIEAESGFLGGVIQTDNTLEAIWCWSRYRELTGLDTYDANIAAAWVYCQRYPAWEEEGGADPNYYRAHNCAWGLTAALQYEAATSDDGFARYAETCAQYIVDYPLNLDDGDVWSQRLDAFAKGWCAGNLYLYGQALGHTGLMAAAVVQGQDVLDWLNTNPRFYLGYEYWAMSSGTSMWGVCNSVFRDDPSAGQTWLAENASEMDLWQDWYQVPGYVWDSAWNVAYGNAHFAVWDVTADPTYWDNGQNITDLLLSLDVDDDGGITAESIDLADEDMSWVTCYLIKFGVDRLMGQPQNHDTGVLKFLDLEDGQVVPVGEPLPLRVIATNFGLTDQSGVTVQFFGNGDPITIPVDLGFAQLDTVVLDLAWVPTIAGDILLTATTLLAGDQDPSNDAATITIHVDGTSSVNDRPVSVFSPVVTRNPFHADTGFRFALDHSQDVEIRIFDVRGRDIARLNSTGLDAGEHTLRWNGRDTANRQVPAGIYLYRVQAGREVAGGKIIRMR